MIKECSKITKLEKKQEALRRSRYDHQTDWLANEDIAPPQTGEQAAKDIVTLMNNYWGICQYFYIFIQLNGQFPKYSKMYNFICIWWIHPKLLTVKPIANLLEEKWNESTTIIFVHQFYTTSSTKYKSFYWEFWVIWLIITLNYQQLPGKQHHNNVCLYPFYTKILLTIGVFIDILELWY